MKKLFMFSLVLLVSRFAMAQFTNYTISPATYTAEDEITITFDFTGTTLAGETDVYLWTWANKDAGSSYPSKDGTINTDWSNSPAAAKLTAVSGSANKFTYKMTGTTMYDLAPGQLKHFQFLAKTKNGSKQTADSKTNAFDPLIFVPTMLRVFPAKVSQNDVISLYFQQDLATTVDLQRMTPASVTVTVYDDLGNSAGTPLNLTVKSTGTNMWRAYFVPTKAYTLASGRKFTRFTYQFKGTVQDENNAAKTVSTDAVEVTLTDMK